MRRLFAWCFRLACLVVPVLLPPSLRAQEGADQVQVIPLRGTPFERGERHGQALRREIAELLARWDRELQEQYGLAIDAFAERFLAGTRFDEAARGSMPELLDEVRGIAAGSGQSYARMLAWQLVDEVWAQATTVLGATAAHDKCTSIGIDRRGEQPTIVAQNLDVPQWYHGSQTVLDIRDDSRHLRQLVVTIPGLVGAAGMNSARVAVAVNTLLQLRPCRDGLPVAFVVRGLLAQPDHESALRFLHAIRHASGQNYTVGGPDTAPGFECSAGKVVRFLPFEGARLTWHTNHPLRNDDFAPAALLRIAAGGTSPFDTACARFRCCTAALTPAAAGADAAPDVAGVVALLADRTGRPSVCNAATYCAIVMLLGETPELRVSKGGCDRAPFLTMTCTW